MSHDDALDALIATAKAEDVPPMGAEDQAWATFAGSPGGGGGDVATGAGAKGVGLALKVVGGAVFVSLAAVGVAQWSASGGEPSVVRPASSAPATVQASVPSQERPVGPAVGVPPVAAPEPPTPVAVQAPARVQSSAAAQPAPAPVVAPSSESTLVEEARLVGSMWKALDLGDAQRALSLAQAHGVRFKEGALRLEARGAALAARCVLGLPTDLRELDAVQKTAAASVVTRISAACGNKP